jgi:hypothetical protein
LNYRFSGRLLFKPPVSVSTGTNEYLEYLYDNDSNAIVFLHSQHIRNKHEGQTGIEIIRSLLVYQVDKNRNYVLLRNTSAGVLESIEYVHVFKKLYMKIILIDAIGKRGLEKDIYRLFDILTDQVRNIIIPHDHMCSKKYTTSHASPLLFGDKILIGCGDRKSGVAVFTLFNITWQRYEGKLSAGPSWYGMKKRMFNTLKGNVFELIDAVKGVYSILLRLPKFEKGQKIPCKFCKPTRGARTIDVVYCEKQALFLILFYRSAHLVFPGIIRMLCIPSRPLIKQHRICEETRINIRHHIQQDHDRHCILIHDNGNLFSPVLSIKRMDKTKTLRTFKYFKLFLKNTVSGREIRSS